MFFVALYALLLYSHILILPMAKQPPVPSGVLGEWLIHHVSSWGAWSKLLAYLHIAGQALLVNYIINRYKMQPDPTYLPALGYILVMGFFHYTPGLNPILLANTFFIIAIWELFKTYRANKCADHIFNIGLWLAVGSLCYLPVGVFLLLGIVGIFMLRSSNFKDYLILFIGFFIPYFLAGTGFFLTDAFPEFLQRQFYDNIGIKDFLTRRDFWDYLKPALTVLAIIGFAIASGNLNTRTSAQAQKNYTLLFWILIISMFSITFQLGITSEHLLLVAMPLGVLLAATLSRIKNITAAELTHLAILIIILGYQYRNILV